MLNWTANQWADFHKRNPEWILGNRGPQNPFNPGPRESRVAPIPADVAGPQPKLGSGIQAHSTNAAYTRYVIFAVGGILQAKQFNAWALGEGIRYKELLGSWKGVHEPSFIVEDTNENRLRIAYWVKGQEALLCLGKAYRQGPDGQYRLYGNREAIFDYLDSDGYTVRDRKPADGLFQPVSRNEALALDGWTFDPTENQYYAIL